MCKNKYKRLFCVVAFIVALTSCSLSPDGANNSKKRSSSSAVDNSDTSSIKYSSSLDSSDSSTSSNSSVFDNYFTVSFDSRGGSEVPSQRVEKGSKARKPDNPVREDYEFINWTYQDEVWSFVGYVVTEDMTLVANWRHVYCNVIFDSNGGSPVSPIKATIGETFSKPTDPKRDSFIFNGWKFQGSLWSFDSDVALDDMTLVADWVSAFDYVGESTIVSVTDKTIENVVIPNKVTTIESGAFEGCSNLKSIVIPDSVTHIGLGAFSGCSSLETITLPFVGEDKDGPDEVSSAVFGYIFGDTAYENSTRIQQLCKGTSNYGANSFAYYYLPNSLKTVHFTGKKLNLGSFSGCAMITTITLEDGITTIRDSSFERCDSLTSFTIPDTVTSIENWSFYLCKSLENITIPKGITYLGQDAFCACESLVSISLENSLITNIYTGTFYGCLKLTSFSIPNSVEGIASEAFRNCQSLTSIHIGSNVTFIGNRAFGGCTSMVSFNVDADNKVYASEDGVLFNKEKTVLYNYPSAKEGEATIPSSVTSIDAYAFEGNTYLQSIVVSSFVQSVGVSAFANCSSLETITFLNPDTTLNSSVFSGCSKLKNVTLPEHLESLSNSLFYNCVSLETINIPATVTVIMGAFSGCSTLKSLNLPNGLTYIGQGAFAGCTSIETLDIPDSVIYVEMFSIVNCASLKTITIGKSVKILGCSYAMMGNENYPSSLDYFFLYCSSLEEIIVDEENEYYSSEDGVLYSGRLSYSQEDEEYHMYGKREALAYYPPDKADEDFIMPNYIEEISISTIENIHLKTATIPANILSFTNQLFSKCSNFEAYYVDDNNLAFTSIDGVLFYRRVEFNEEGETEYLGDLDTLFAYPANKSDTEYSIPSNIECVGSYAFYNNKNLERVTFPNRQYFDIYESAFENCLSLNYVDIPINTWMYERAFYNSPLGSCNYKGTISELESHCYEDVPSVFSAGTTIHCINGNFVVGE